MEDIKGLVHSQTHRLHQVALEVEVVKEFLLRCRPRRAKRREQLLSHLRSSIAALRSDCGENPAQRDVPATLVEKLARLELRITEMQSLEAEDKGAISPTTDLAQESLHQMLSLRRRPRVNRMLWRGLRDDLLALVWAERSLMLKESLLHIHELLHQSRGLLDYLSDNAGPERQNGQTILLLEDVVAKAVKGQAAFARARGIDFRLKIPSATVRGSERELVRAVSNVLNNGIKYSHMMKSGRAWIEIEGRKTSSVVELRIESWGLAIPPDEIASGKLWEAGYRGSLASLSGFEGSGLGLADVARVVNSHGGSVEIESRPTKELQGRRALEQPFVTTVRIRLPTAGDDGD